MAHTNTTHTTHHFASDSHHRCTYCTRQRLFCDAPCDQHPAVVASRIRMFGAMVVRVYGKRRMKAASPAQLATAFQRWSGVTPAEWPGYDGHRIAKHNAHWVEFLSAELPESELELAPFNGAAAA